MYGDYGISWTPRNQGLYQIIASFTGTKSYGSLTASTYVSVGQASSTQQSSQINTPASTDIYLAIALVVIIVLVAAILVLRRKK
jgi:hypothetical protein